jgi:phage head maturation protease
MTEYDRPLSQVVQQGRRDTPDERARSEKMPFVVRKDGPEATPYCVYTEGEGGKRHGCHATEAEARAQQRALYANVPEARKDADPAPCPECAAVKAGTRPAEKEGAPKSPPQGYPESRDDYADPENYRYPLDTETHVRAALSYWGKPANREGYSVSEQAFITARIHAAAKKLGIEVEADAEKKSAGENFGILTPEDAPPPSDILIAIGGAVKAMGAGKIRVRLAPYSDASDPDLDGEFFDAKTDFDRDFPAKLSLYYHHGADEEIGTKRLGRVEVQEDGAGLWFDHQLNLSDAYQAKIYTLAEQGRLGGSSGAVTHLVRKSRAGKAVHIDLWPLGEASLTVTPCHPAARAIAVKSLSDLESPPSLGEERASAMPPRSLATDTERWLSEGGEILGVYRQIEEAEVKVGRKLSASRRQRLSDMRTVIDDLLAETAPEQVTGTEQDSTAASRDGEQPDEGAAKAADEEAEAEFARFLLTQGHLNGLAFQGASP